MIKTLTILIFISFFAWLSICVASDPVADDPLLTVTESVKVDRYVKHVIFLNDYNPGTDTVTFNSAGATTDIAGQLDTSAILDDIEIQIDIGTLGSASATVTAYGATRNANGTWGVIYTQTYTAVTGANGADRWPIAERPDAFRIGVSVDTPGTDAITITGDFITKRR